MAVVGMLPVSQHADDGGSVVIVHPLCFCELASLHNIRLFFEPPLQGHDHPVCPTGLVLMAIGFAGLGYAAQRALTLARKVAPTDEAAAVEAAKVEGIVSKVADTSPCMPPSRRSLKATSAFPL